jgi:xanthine/uracil/vitamin C permease (AzgA family)
LIVGITMLGHADALDWPSLYSAVPGALTALVAAFTADLALAIMLGTGTSALLWALTGKYRT